MKSLYFQSFFYVFLNVLIFLFVSEKTLGTECRPISDYLISKENPNFQVVKLDVQMKDNAYRSRELMVVLTKTFSEKSWFGILTLIKKPLVDSPSCTP